MPRPKKKDLPASPAPASTEVPTLAPGQKLTQDALERHLWSAADILRGSIDSSDYKNFIFGLLFLKRLSDRFEEECTAVRAEGGNPEDPDEHEFFVPKRARWPEVQKHATNLGEVLNKAAAAIEQDVCNGAALEGLPACIDFNNEQGSATRASSKCAVRPHCLIHPAATYVDEKATVAELMAIGG